MSDHFWYSQLRKEDRFAVSEVWDFEARYDVTWAPSATRVLTNASNSSLTGSEFSSEFP